MRAGIGHPDLRRWDEVLVRLRLEGAQPDVMEPLFRVAARMAIDSPLGCSERCSGETIGRDRAAAMRPAVTSEHPRPGTRLGAVTRSGLPARHGVNSSVSSNAVGVRLDRSWSKSLAAATQSFLIMSSASSSSVSWPISGSCRGRGSRPPGRASPSPRARPSCRGRRRPVATSTRRRSACPAKISFERGASCSTSSVIWVAARGLWWPNSSPIAQPRR